MRKILVIDDLRRFRERPADSDVTMARTSRAALDILATPAHWDEIWLDHDLGEQDGIIDSIMVVIDYMSERAFNEDPINVDKVLVHTSNPSGARAMMVSLERYGYATQRVMAERYFIV